MAAKITYWLLATLMLSLGFGQLLRFEISGLPIYVHDVVVVMILGIQGESFKQICIPMSLRFLFAGLVLGLLRAATLYPLASLLIPSLYTLRLVAYLALYLVLAAQQVRINPKYFVLAGFITLSIGITQYLLLPDMRVFQYLGWDDHLNRLTLPHFDPTFTAAMLVIASLSLTDKATSLPLSPPHLLVALLTYARSVWLSLALTCIFFIKNRLALLVVLGIMLLAIATLPKRFGEGTNLWRTYSITSRIEADYSYLVKYKWDLLIGRGMNTTILDASRSERPNHMSGPNNSYLYLLVTTGIVGLVGMLLFIKDIYVTSSHKSMVIFILIASLFNNILLYPFVLLWLLLVGFMAPSGVASSSYSHSLPGRQP